MDYACSCSLLCEGKVGLIVPALEIEGLGLEEVLTLDPV